MAPSFSLPFHLKFFGSPSLLFVFRLNTKLYCRSILNDADAAAGAICIKLAFIQRRQQSWLKSMRK